MDFSCLSVESANPSGVPIQQPGSTSALLDMEASGESLREPVAADGAEGVDGCVVEDSTDTAAGDSSCCRADSEAELAPMTKNALRKLRGQKRLQEIKDRRRALRAEAKRRKKEAKREAVANGAVKRQVCLSKDAGLSVRICVDCEFEDLQTESEIFSLVQQLMYAYGDANRLNRMRDKASGTKRRWKSGWRGQHDAEQISCTSTANTSSGATEYQGSCSQQSETEGRLSTADPSPAAGQKESASSPADETNPGCPTGSLEPQQPAVEFCITGVGPKITEALRRVQCNGRWKCEVSSAAFEKRFSEMCAAGQVVYLSADADQELETLHPDTLYVVGGIVDRNRYKGLTLKRSSERGVKAAKLPIASKLGRKLEGSKILTVNQVGVYTRCII